MSQAGLMSAYIIKTLYFGRYEETLHLRIYQLCVCVYVYNPGLIVTNDPVNWEENKFIEDN